MGLVSKEKIKRKWHDVKVDTLVGCLWFTYASVSLIYFISEQLK